MKSALLLVTLLLVLHGVVLAAPIDDAMAANRISGGLVVVAEPGDAVGLVSAGTSGKFLVHALVSQNSGLNSLRGAVMAAGKYGLVSAERIENWAVLPYAPDQVNLLVADLDGLASKGLTQAEIERVLIPAGVAYIKSAGSWKWITKAWDANLGDLSHWFANAQGNSVTDDKRVAPPTALRWAVGDKYQLKMRMSTNTGIRAVGGVVSYSHQNDAMTENAKSGMHLVGRDAFNGLLLWEKDDPRKIHEIELECQRYVMGDGRLFHYPKLDDYAVALDARTGQVVSTYSRGLKLTGILNAGRIRGGDNSARTNVRGQELVYQKGYLIQTGGNRLVVLDAASGNVVWEKTETAGLWFQRPVITPESDKMFVMLMYSAVSGSRWPLGDLKNVIAYNLKNGAELWRNTEVDKKFSMTWIKDGNLINTFDTYHCIGQMGYSNGYLAFLGPEPLSGSQERIVTAMSINATTGKVAWVKQTQTYAYSSIIRADTMYVINAQWTYPFALRDGGGATVIPYERNGQTWTPSKNVGYNGRCNRTTATTNYMVVGLGTWYKSDWSWLYSGVSRSSCATGPFHGQGQTMFTPNGCGCIGQPHRGYQAVRFDKPTLIVADNKRTASASGLPAPLAAGQTLSVQGPVIYDWTHNNADGYILENTDPVSAGGLSLIARVHQHRIDALQGSAVKWSFMADGRISMKPVISGDLAVFGSHDGYVYAVKVADGTPVWRFMAAPGFKKVNAYGQLESAWPVFGVTLSGNTVAFSAGRQSELDGGIWVYGVDAATGALKWKKQAVTQTLVLSAENVPNIGTLQVVPGSGSQLVNQATLSSMGIDPANPQDILLSPYKPGRNGLKFIGTPYPLVDIPLPDVSPVAVSFKPADAYLKSSGTFVDLPALTSRALQFGVHGTGTHQVYITSGMGREVARFAAQKGPASYSVPRGKFSAGLFIIRVNIEGGQQVTRPFRLF